MKKPVIGMAFPKPDYKAALEKAGAQVRELRPDQDPLPGSLDGLDGVLLTGGPDVRPALYGAGETHSTVEIDDTRDAYELPLAKAAMDRRMPLLAICRGVQVLNVAAGGTLIQDLPTERPGGLNHSVNTPTTAISHDVAVVPGTLLEKIVAPQLKHGHRLDVNSRHHQAIDAVAPGFVASASASDGTVEAIEAGAQLGFCVGVQWHPENFWRTGETALLFESFVSAARRKQGETAYRPTDQTR